MGVFCAVCPARVMTAPGRGVQLVFGKTRVGRYLPGGIFQPDSLGHQPQDLLCPLLQRDGGGLPGRAARHHQHVFSLGGVFLVIGRHFSQGGAHSLLVELRQLPAQGHPAARAEGLPQVLQRGAQLVGRLVEDHGPLLVFQRVQPFPGGFSC